MNKFRRRILVTGGAGFIGSALADALVAQEDNLVVALDDLSTGKEENLPDDPPPNYRFIKCDVNNYYDVAEVMLSYRFNFIFHYAALVGVKRTLNNPVQVLRDIHGIRNILNLAKNTGAQRVFYASSSEVYGETSKMPQHEQATPLNSRLPYAIVKNVGEAFLRAYQREYGLDYTILRLFNTYGPAQSLDFVMSRFIRAALWDEKITIYGDGKQTRTFCYIKDNIDLTLRIFYDDLHVNDVINVGNNEEVSILKLARTVHKVTGSRSELVHLPPLKQGDMNRRMPDITKMRKVLDRKLIPLEKGIKKVVDSGKWK